MNKTALKLLATALIIIGLYIGAVALFGTHTASPEERAKQAMSKYDKGKPDAQEMLDLVNNERANNGAAPLTIDPRLSKSAQRKADDMVKYNYFEHVSPHDGRHGYQYVFDATGDTCTHASENLHAEEDATSGSSVDGWISSPPHHKAMIDKRYTLTGFGVAYDPLVRLSEINDGLGEAKHDLHSAYLVVEHFCQTK